MSRKTPLLFAILATLGGCASGVGPVPVRGPAVVPNPVHEVARPSRLRSVASSSSGLRSVLFPPVAVDALVSVGPKACCRASVGAIFATQEGDAEGTSGLALVIRLDGGGLSSVLSTHSSVAILIAGEPLLDAAIDPRLYSRARGPLGPVETVIVPLADVSLRKMARGAEVLVILGASVRFTLGPEQLSGFEALLAEIPGDTYFGPRIAVAPRKIFISD